MSKRTQEILIRANTIFSNITDNAAAKALLAEYSYDDAKIAAGKALFEAAKAAADKNMNEYSDKFAATAAYHDLRSTARQTYMKYTRLARVALADTSVAYNQLGLTGPRGNSFSRISEQITLFYTNALANPAILAKLTEFGLTEAKLTAGLASFTAAQVAHAQQQREISEAVSSTESRDQVILALSQWIGAFLSIASIALEDHPEVLATLGV